MFSRYTKYLLICMLLCAANTASALTDPTKPSNYIVQSKQPTYVLESILYSDERKVAVINGKALVEGDKLGSAEILSISKEQVRVKLGNRMSVLKLQRQSIRQEK